MCDSFSIKKVDEVALLDSEKEYLLNIFNGIIRDIRARAKVNKLTTEETQIATCSLESFLERIEVKHYKTKYNEYK